MHFVVQKSERVQEKNKSNEKESFTKQSVASLKKKSVLTDDGMFSLEGARRTLQLCSVKARKRQLWEDRCSTDCHFQR